MSKQFFDILSEGQKETFSLLRTFSIGGVLAGGTALALQLGHRKSYDFDFFRPKPLSRTFLFQIKNISRQSVFSLTPAMNSVLSLRRG